VEFFLINNLFVNILYLLILKSIKYIIYEYKMSYLVLRDFRNTKNIQLKLGSSTFLGSRPPNIFFKFHGHS